MGKKPIQLDDKNTYKNKGGLEAVMNLIESNLADFDEAKASFINKRKEPLDSLNSVELIHSMWESALSNDSRFELELYSIIERNIDGESDSAKALEAINVASKIVFTLGYEKLSLELLKAKELYFREMIRRIKAGVSKAEKSTTKVISNSNRDKARKMAIGLLYENGDMELREAIKKITASKECHVAEKSVRGYIKDLFPQPKKGRPASN